MIISIMINKYIETLTISSLLSLPILENSPILLEPKTKIRKTTNTISIGSLINSIISNIIPLDTQRKVKFNDEMNIYLFEVITIAT